MSGNSQGSARVSTAGQMECFDKLPPSARMALSNALFDWATPSIYRAWRNGSKGFKTGAQIAKLVPGWDADAHAKDVKRGKVAP